MLSKFSARELVRGNAPGYCAGQNWLYAVLDSTHHAYAIWGVPDEREICELLALFDDSYDKFTSHSIVADLSNLDAVNLAPFARFRWYFDKNSQPLANMVTDACVVVADSLAGSVAAGFLGIVRAPFAFTTTKLMAEAAQRLG